METINVQRPGGYATWDKVAKPAEVGEWRHLDLNGTRAESRQGHVGARLGEREAPSYDI